MTKQPLTVPKSLLNIIFMLYNMNTGKHFWAQDNIDINHKFTMKEKKGERKKKEGKNANTHLSPFVFAP